MQFTRKIDSSYPIIYESWVTDDAEWVIQDLQPEDEDEALKILVENLCTEETLLSVQEVLQDSESVIHLCECWRACISQRMSLGCYEFKYGQKTLVGLSICVVVGTDEDPDVEMRGEKLQNVYNGLKYIEYQVDPYHHMDVDFVLLAVGLVVKRWYRGAKLGKKLIAAREPLCRIQGVKGAATICTSTAAQKLSASCGFETLAEVTVGQLADNASLPYPKEDTRVLMYMAKKYSDVQSKRSYFESFFSRKTQKTF